MEQGKSSAQAADSIALVHVSDPHLLQTTCEPLRCGASGACSGPTDMCLPFAISAPKLQVQLADCVWRACKGRYLAYLTAPGLAGDVMQLEGLLRSGDSGSLAARVAAALGFCVQGADPGAGPGPDPSPDAQPALQLAWQGRALPYDAMQLDPSLGEPPYGSFHVLAAAALGEAAGGAAPAGAPPSAEGEPVPVEGTPRKGPGAGRKAKGTSSSQYR